MDTQLLARGRPDGERPLVLGPVVGLTGRTAIVHDTTRGRAIMDGRVTSMVALGRAETERAPQQFGPDLGNASGRIAVTKADKGVAPAGAGAAPTVTATGSTTIAVVDAPEHALVRSKLSEYLDDTLDVGLWQRVDRHLRACPDCMAYLRTLRATVDALQHLPHRKAPPAGIARVLERARRDAAELLDA